MSSTSKIRTNISIRLSNLKVADDFGKGKFNGLIGYNIQITVDGKRQAMMYKRKAWTLKSDVPFHLP